MADELGGLTVREYASIWLGDVRARAHPATLERYENEYRGHIDPELGAVRLRDVTRLELKRLVIRKAGSGHSPSMLIRVLSNLFSSAFEDGRIDRQPAHRLWKVVRREERTEDVQAFTKEQLAIFLECAALEPVYSVLFRTMAFSGVRVGEGRALRAGDVHPEAGKLDVMRTFSGDTISPSTKSRAARRIEIPAELAELLGRLARGRDSGVWLFERGGDPLLSRAVSLAFRRVLRSAGLPAHHGTHSLRHTYASNLIQDGVPIDYVQKQLGHRSIRQTVDVYGRWLTRSNVAALDRFVAATKTAGAPEEEPASEDESPGRLLRFRLRRSAGFERTSCSETSLPQDDDPDSEIA